MHIAARERLELMSEMQRALDLGQFVLHYQPYADLESGGIVGLEALVRWRHPKRGLLLPGEFITLSEETGLIVQIGRWVLEEACQQASLWDKQGNGSDEFVISVNLSSRQLQEAEIVDDVSRILQQSGLPPHRLMLEITESVLMQDTSITLSKLEALKELGVLLAVDDFGTGYSSLSYLKRFPLDVIKVAKSFIDEMSDGPEDAALIQAIIKMGRTMRLRTIAEGIEHSRQWSLLRELECSMGQGFYFSGPLDTRGAGDLLDKRDDIQGPHSSVGARIEALLSPAERT
jgi:EAL domain-containing protein (putative c-di-GMP-specific phosphodiesterase class I)